MRVGVSMKKKTERVMFDKPHVGVLGVVAVICIAYTHVEAVRNQIVFDCFYEQIQECGLPYIDLWFLKTSLETAENPHSYAHGWPSQNEPFIIPTASQTQGQIRAI